VLAVSRQASPPNPAIWYALPPPNNDRHRVQYALVQPSQTK
jgi:hypothetical protein